MEDSDPIEGKESSMRKKTPHPTIESQRWEGGDALNTVHRLNQRAFALLGGLPHEDAVLEALWEQVDERVCERAGRCPVLLLDLHLQRGDWWQRASQRSTNSPRGENIYSPGVEQAASLVCEILIDAWTIGRIMPRAANLIFGMATPVLATILQMGPPELERIAVEEAPHLKARWSESHSFWIGLLEAAIGTDDQALANVHLHCLQLLGSEVVPS
jgi:hypothetical protein